MGKVTLEELRQRGLVVFTRGDGKIYVTPAHALTAEDREAITRDREHLLDELWQEQEPLCVPAWSEPRMPHLHVATTAEALQIVQTWNEAMERHHGESKGKPRTRKQQDDREANLLGE